MREPRLWVDQPLTPGGRINLDSGAARYLLQVLRLRTGSLVLAFNDQGAEHAALLSMAGRDGAYLDIQELRRWEVLPKLELHLLLGISKGERMDFSLQKAVELGVTRISPLLTRRNVVELRGERLERRLQHWRQILAAAAAQCGRCRLPALDAPHALEQALDGAQGDLDILLYHRGTASLPELAPPRRSIRLLIGPEGGMEPEEVSLAQRRGFIPVRLGPRILRTETAPLAALAAIQALWGDFRPDD